jgi:Na+-translocating ferredoxin:NAD+ oxidoreductase RnfG subunit
MEEKTGLLIYAVITVLIFIALYKVVYKKLKEMDREAEKEAINEKVAEYKDVDEKAAMVEPFKERKEEKKAKEDTINNFLND